MSLRRGAGPAWLILTAFLAIGAASGQGKDAGKAEAELKAVKAQIEKVSAQVRRDQVDRSRLTKELRSAEVSVAGVREELSRLRRERDERAAKRDALAKERTAREAELKAEQSALAAELRSAYLIGREEPLKLLLNQQDPARAGRMFAYYSYFGRARAERIASIDSKVAEIAKLDEAVAAEEARLADLEVARKAELQRLDAARAERGKALVAFNAESKSRAQALEQLKKQQAGLEKLVKELNRSLEKFPVDSKSAFAKLRGQLAWPVSGKIEARYGTSRAGAIKWDGMVVSTARGAQVRSVYHGRIAYADWLPGLGLLVIVDHGNGYLSLYGHNDQIFKAAGERVTAGDVIAAAGDSGGRSSPGLYFEIRRQGKPVDPRPWFRTPAPAP